MRSKKASCSPSWTRRRRWKHCPKVSALEVAEADYRAAIKTKEEAIRRAASAEFLWKKGQGFISEDDYRAAQLNRDRYIEEEKAKLAAVHLAEHKVRGAQADLEACEIRSSDAGVVKAILKRRGEAVHSLEPIVRLEVEEAAGTDAPMSAPSVNVPSRATACCSSSARR